MGTSDDFMETMFGTVARDGPISDTKIRAYIWARVSTDMQEERGLSIPEQIREIEDYAKEKGIEVASRFSEAASAFQREHKRTEFLRMLEEAKTDPLINAIIVHDFSRFSRDSARAKTLIRELRDKSVRVISLNDPEIDPDSVAGVYMEAITFAKNEAYSREIAFHTRKGCRANIQARDPKSKWCYKNGGQPPWGYRTKPVNLGQGRNNRPIIKSTWEKDDAVVAGKPVHEWVHHCLVNLAAKGATLKELRDFCNEKGIPARRGKFWSTSSWNALMKPSVLLQFAGHGVWNVHRKNGTMRPPSEWIVVEDAHPAIISEEEALSIRQIRQDMSHKWRFASSGRSRKSRYILSGGLFKCARCGKNMAGLRTSSGDYYICGSQPYRGGMGCGQAVYVQKKFVEKRVFDGFKDVVGACDKLTLVNKINHELNRIWKRATGYDPNLERRIKNLDTRIKRLWDAIELGIDDTEEVVTRIKSLKEEREKLAARPAVSTSPPRIDAGAIKKYLGEFRRLLKRGTPTELKKLAQACVQKMKLAPEERVIEITYRLPEPVMESLVAGAGFEPATFGL